MRSRGDAGLGHAEAARGDGAPDGVHLDLGLRARVLGGDERLPLQTTNPKVFAGGDMWRGADLVVRAVLDGREAAKAIKSMFATQAAAAELISA